MAIGHNFYSFCINIHFQKSYLKKYFVALPLYFLVRFMRKKTPLFWDLYSYVGGGVPFFARSAQRNTKDTKKLLKNGDKLAYGYSNDYFNFFIL
jgi:hypothetical protein